MDSLLETHPLSPCDSAQFIVEHAKHVWINHDCFGKVCEQIACALHDGSFRSGNWANGELNPKYLDVRAADWIFVVDLLNFSFWSETGAQYTVSYKGTMYTGYWSLCAAVNRAIDEGFDLLDPSNYQNITEQQLKHIFRSDSGIEIPLFCERLFSLQHAGKELTRAFGGTFVNVIRSCEKSAIKLLSLVCTHFPSFRDTAVYQNKQVSFMKRGQILVGDLWSCFGGKDLGEFDDIKEVTAFADYRLPQVLFFFGVISYSEELMQALRNGESIPNGSPMEIEIRGATIHSVQLIVEKVLELLRDKFETKGDLTSLCNAIIVDNYLWTYRRAHAEEIDRVIPMHRTRCVFY